MSDILPVFGGDSYSASDNFMTGCANNIATYRNSNFFGLVDGLDFALQYQGSNRGAGESANGRDNALAYVQSKVQKLDEEFAQVKYIELGSTYYFNKNMAVYADYKFNLLNKNDDAV